MRFHRDRRRTKIPTAIPVGPKGCGPTSPFWVSLLLAMNELCFDRRSYRPPRSARNNNIDTYPTGHYGLLVY
jgi:hypothetical protein